MTIARRQLIDVSVARWYHCMSRCVRGASLLRSESSDRKAWLEDRIEELAQIFALGVGGFSGGEGQALRDAALMVRRGRRTGRRTGTLRSHPIVHAWIIIARQTLVLQAPRLNKPRYPTQNPQSIQILQLDCS